MKKALSLILALTIFLCAFSIPTFAANVDVSMSSDYSQDEIWSYVVLENQTIEIDGYYGNESDLEIPDTISGYTVSQLSAGLFSNNTVLENVIIPDTVVIIRDSAFINIPTLKSVTLSKNLKEIDDSAFADCIALTGVNLPYGLEYIGDWAFSNCNSLKEIIIPDSVTQIEYKSIGYTYDATTDEYVPDPDFVIYGKSGSYAEHYAQEYFITFIEKGQTTLLIGDSDLDDEVTIIDATNIQRYLAKMFVQNFSEQASDADEDDDITILDTTIIQKYLAGMPTSSRVGLKVSVEYK